MCTVTDDRIVETCRHLSGDEDGYRSRRPVASRHVNHKTTDIFAGQLLTPMQHYQRVESTCGFIETGCGYVYPQCVLVDSRCGYHKLIVRIYRKTIAYHAIIAYSNIVDHSR